MECNFFTCFEELVLPPLDSLGIRYFHVSVHVTHEILCVHVSANWA